MATITKDPSYQMLIDSIQQTFKGSDKVAEVQASLYSLFEQFDKHAAGKTSKMTLQDTRNVQEEREMLMGVITILLHHLIKGN